MNELPVHTFEKAIQATHGCRSALRERVEVREEFEGRPVWEGEVLVFVLIDHPTATTCYAWSVDQKVTAVLAEGPVDSPAKAVRAAILHEQGYRQTDCLDCHERCTGRGDHAPDLR